MQNPDVKNIAVVLMKTKPKAKPQKLNYTKLKDETWPEAILMIYSMKKKWGPSTSLSYCLSFKLSFSSHYLQD